MPLCCLQRTRTPPPVGEQAPTITAASVARLNEDADAVRATPVPRGGLAASVTQQDSQQDEFHPAMPVSPTYPATRDDDVASVHSLGSISIARSAASSVALSRKRRIVRGVLDLRPAPRTRSAHFYEKQMTGLCRTMHSHKKSIRVLLLGRNHIDDKAAKLLTDFVMSSPVLEYLELTQCQLTERAILMLMRQITGVNSECKQLVTVNLAGNNITGRMGAQIAQMLAQPASPVVNLLIHHNPITIRGVANFVQCPKLQTLDARSCFSPPPAGANTGLIQKDAKKWQAAFRDGLTALCANLTQTNMTRVDLRENKLNSSHIDSMNRYKKETTTLIFTNSDAAIAPPPPMPTGLSATDTATNIANPTSPTVPAGQAQHEPDSPPQQYSPTDRHHENSFDDELLQRGGSSGEPSRHHRPGGGHGISPSSPTVPLHHTADQQEDQYVHRPASAMNYRYDSDDDENFSYEHSGVHTDHRTAPAEYDDYCQYSPPRRHRPRGGGHYPSPNNNPDSGYNNSAYAEHSSPAAYYDHTSFERAYAHYSVRRDDTSIPVNEAYYDSSTDPRGPPARVYHHHAPPSTPEY
eukprot:TRINITY_DN68090_c2_g1_i1.p1 TRINITY_DN68090_c2_g1~~TRINITY_DN68090_c2_g1_i1.p1  ORF type:complete len:579 (-),score=62.51 TRINITY_DN68090_c2_g1_i1:713-2449(-)